jgi:hypothetical protein
MRILRSSRVTRTGSTEDPIEPCQDAGRRGPTRHISGLKTFQNCGNGSMVVLRRNLSIGVTR